MNDEPRKAVVTATAAYVGPAGRCRTWTCGVVIGAALIALVGAAIRSWSLQESLWLDELHTAWVVDGPLADVARRAEAGNQSPTYFWGLWCVRHTFGFSEAGLRFLSLLAGVGLILFTCGVVWSLTGDSSLALLAALFVALDPNFIFYAREARPYACLQLLSLIQIWTFVGCLGRSKLAFRMTWVVSSITILYLHYTAGCVFLGEFLALVGWLAWHRERRWIRNWSIDGALVVLATLPRWQHVAEVMARRQQWSAFVRAGSASQILTMFSVEIYVLVPVLLVLMGWCLPQGRCDDRGDDDRNPFAVMWTCATVFAAPMTLAWSLTRWFGVPVFFRRYLISLAVLPILVGALLGVLLRRGVPRLLFALSFSLIVLMHLPRFDPQHPMAWSGTHGREDWRGAIGWLDRQANQANWPIYVRSGLIEDDALRESPSEEFRAYCLFPVSGPYRLKRAHGPLIPLPSTASWRLEPDALRNWQEAGGGWFLVRGTPDRTASIVSRLAAELGVRAEQFVGPVSFGNVVAFGIPEV